MASKGKLLKLRSRQDFDHLAKSGKRSHINSWLLFNFTENDFGHLRCGWTIPRYVGNAVVRNRIRRWCREFFITKRKQAWDPNIDLNIVVRKRDKKFFKELSHQEFKTVLDRGTKKLDKALK